MANLSTVTVALDHDGFGHLSPLDEQHIAELRNALGDTKLEKLLSLLAADLPGRIARLRVSDCNSNLSALRSDLHNFKGMVASFGLQRVAAAADAVLVSHRGCELENALERLETEVEYALACLSQANRAPDAAANLRDISVTPMTARPSRTA